MAGALCPLVMKIQSLDEALSQRCCKLYVLGWSTEQKEFPHPLFPRQFPGGSRLDRRASIWNQADTVAPHLHAFCFRGSYSSCLGGMSADTAAQGSSAAQTMTGEHAQGITKKRKDTASSRSQGSRPAKKPKPSSDSTRQAAKHALRKNQPQDAERKEAAVNADIAAMDPPLLADLLGRQVRRFETHLSLLELEERRVPGECHEWIVWRMPFSGVCR